MRLTQAKLFLSCLCLLILSSGISAQDVIIFNNGLEDTPRRGTTMTRSVDGWLDCGATKFPNESPPDIHPDNFWKVNLAPAQGQSYVGLVVRQNDTYESISQGLDIPLKKGQCYTFSIYLSRSDDYWSGTTDLSGRRSSTQVNYTTPAIFRLWGGKIYCGQSQLLAESDPVNSSKWTKYEFEIKPATDINYITYQAFYEIPNWVPYNGHILLDDASNFQEIDCESKEEIHSSDPVAEVQPDKPQKVEEQNIDEPEEVTVVTPVQKEKREYKQPKILTELRNPKSLKVGKTIRLRNLYFQADTSTINKTSYGVLNELSEFLLEYPNFKMELGGHTNNIPLKAYCDSLSLERAEQVYIYLINRGVKESQLTYKGYGKKHPIASNNTTVGRARNQRVEIKILAK